MGGYFARRAALPPLHHRWQGYENGSPYVHSLFAARQRMEISSLPGPAPERRLGQDVLTNLIRNPEGASLLFSVRAELLKVRK